MGDAAGHEGAGLLHLGLRAPFSDSDLAASTLSAWPWTLSGASRPRQDSSEVSPESSKSSKSCRAPALSTRSCMSRRDRLRVSARAVACFRVTSLWQTIHNVRMFSRPQTPPPLLTGLMWSACHNDPTIGLCFWKESRRCGTSFAQEAQLVRALFAVSNLAAADAWPPWSERTAATAAEAAWPASTPHREQTPLSRRRRHFRR